VYPVAQITGPNSDVTPSAKFPVEQDSDELLGEEVGEGLPADEHAVALAAVAASDDGPVSPR
jgi:hypothetical protein